LKEVVRRLERGRVPWWTLRSEELVNRLHYPVTTSADEWADEILHLDQLIIEGFEEQWLRTKAEALGCMPQPTFRSLKLAEECLVALGFDDDHAREIIDPLQTVHHLRSKLKGHAANQEAIKLRKKALLEHKTYHAHFRTLCERCDKSMRIIRDALKEPDEANSLSQG